MPIQAHGNRNGEGEELWKTQIADNMKLFAEKEKVRTVCC
jgi:hypothetical protein